MLIHPNERAITIFACRKYSHFMADCPVLNMSKWTFEGRFKCSRYYDGIQVKDSACVQVVHPRSYSGRFTIEIATLSRSPSKVPKESFGLLYEEDTGEITEKWHCTGGRPICWKDVAYVDTGGRDLLVSSTDIDHELQ